jgi:hypothetical protein
LAAILVEDHPFPEHDGPGVEADHPDHVLNAVVPDVAVGSFSTTKPRTRAVERIIGEFAV